jgi:SAM-dependent methyltransferase
MTDTIWSDLHKDYAARDWIHKPSLFAETAITYFPPSGRLLDLGAGQGQDSRFFAERGYTVVSADIDEFALQQSESSTNSDIKQNLSIQRIDLRDPLPFGNESFDIVYAHLSLHYFDFATTTKIFDEIYRVLRPGGVFAFFVNSKRDPEYTSGAKLEDDYLQIGNTAKRFFDVAAAQQFAYQFNTILADDQGETYKDTDKGIHNLIRYIGSKA